MRVGKIFFLTVLALTLFLIGLVGGKRNWDGWLLSRLPYDKKEATSADVTQDKSGLLGANERKVLYWVDPMHPKYKSDKPGKAPDCGMDLVPVYADEETWAEKPPEGAFKIPTGKQQLMGVRYGTVIQAPMKKTLRAVGRIVYDETRIARVHPKIEGWIEKVYVDFTGKLVDKDQPLVDIYSPALLSTQQEYLLAAKAREHLASNSFKEISSGAVSLYESSRKRLLLWDIDEKTIDEIEKAGQPRKALTLYSPIRGFVLARNAYERQRITPETELYAVADLSNVWVLAEIYEYELELVRVGQKAQLELTYFPGNKFEGIVDYIFPQLDSNTRTLKVRIQVPNPRYLLKPDMYANVTFHISYGTRTAVPVEAVLNSGAEQTVFVAHENGFFEPRKVKIGGEVEDHYIILEGLKPGERVVISGNFLIDSESRLKSAMDSMVGMGHGPAPEKGKAETGKTGETKINEPESHEGHGQSQPKSEHRH
ncbi:MAG: efflux RND transporter periplasmic adaptor subunit [Acidobacteria bacterium]|nr:efflux RND transporter periplasmic adaptor subunit [Acidobacteriota bacterium]